MVKQLIEKESVGMVNNLLEPSETHEIIFKTLTSIAESTGRPLPTREEVPELKISDDGEFDINTSSGWLNKMSFNRIVHSQDRIQVFRTLVQKQ